jgi:hypothetical protein
MLSPAAARLLLMLPSATISASDVPLSCRYHITLKQSASFHGTARSYLGLEV